MPVNDGTRVLVDDTTEPTIESSIQNATYGIFESLEVNSATVIDILTSNYTNKSYCVVCFDNDIQDIAIIPGILSGDKKLYLNIQIPVITNLKISNKNEIDDARLLAMVVSINKSGDVTLVKIDKNVKNNNIMFWKSV